MPIYIGSSGGEDVLSIGYTEFIAPMISTIQTMDETIKSQGLLIAELTARLDNL